jgi:hypothetical protein
VAVANDVDEESGVRDRFAGMIAVEGLGATLSNCVTTMAPVEAAPPDSAGSSVRFRILRI